jgi:hypothetical protein
LLVARQLFADALPMRTQGWDSREPGWFTEGFDTADLKDVKALLDQLNG